jgi:hypothetical protein
MSRLIINSIIFITLLSCSLLAQEEDQQLNLKGKHSISMSMGMRANSNSIIVRTPSIYSNRDNDNIDINAGFMGTLAYNYWFDDEWSLNFQVGLINADIDVDYLSSYSSDDYTNVSSNSITPFLMGFKYYPKFLSMGNVGRVFAGLNFGAYIGATSRTSYLLFSETMIETVFGAEPNAGIDLFVTKWLRLGPYFNCNLHTKFKTSGLNNDTAFGFMVNMGVIF